MRFHKLQKEINFELKVGVQVKGSGEAVMQAVVNS